MCGILFGLIFGTHEGLNQLQIGFYLPEILPFGFPTRVDFTFALFALVLPQIPMTLGNAVIAYADLSKEYFGDAARKITYRSASISMVFANLVSFIMGGIPLCHGAGGLAAHYRFGARTAGSNMIIGLIFIVLALIFGPGSVFIMNLIPMSVLGVLLLFAGSQLALTIIDIQGRRDLFIVLVILGITLASNLAFGFIFGIGIAYGMKSEKLRV